MAVEFVDEPGWSDLPPGFAGIVKPPQPPEDSVEDFVGTPQEVPLPADTPEVIHVGETPHAEPVAPLSFSQPLPPQAPADTDPINRLTSVLTEVLGGTRRVGGQQAAEFILGLLDERYVMMIRERAHFTGASECEVIAGILTLAGDRGTLGEFSLNENWRTQIHSMESVAPSLTPNAPPAKITTECPQCQQKFETERSGQKYCCSGCGKIASGYKERYTHTTECKTPAAKLVAVTRKKNDEVAAAQAAAAAQAEQADGMPRIAA